MSTTDANTYRRYEAACPQCGAPVRFASAASAFAVCSYCQSTLSRDGEQIARIGQVSELIDDHSPVQIGASGVHAGLPFTALGRVQYRYEDGAWSEWALLFDNGRWAWLAEDNGRHVMAIDQPPLEPSEWAIVKATVGERVTLRGQAWQVASRVRATLGSAQGELPQIPRFSDCLVIELRSADQRVCSIVHGLDERKQPFSTVSLAQPVTFTDLKWQGLKTESQASTQATSHECPNCGAALTPHLDSTRTIVCGQCHSVVDIKPEVGEALVLYRQQQGGVDGLQCQIALGSSSKPIALGGPAVSWQVLGYAERQTLGGDDTEFWREYLLHHPSQGFAFLVDANDGWSYATPITGVPVVDGKGAVLGGKRFQELYRYRAETTYVLGEFYWRLGQGERSQHIDYATLSGRGQRLNFERTEQEQVWSAGESLTSRQVAEAFGLSPEAAKRQEPASAGSPRLVWIVVIIVVLLLLLMLSKCGSDSSRCNSLAQEFGTDSPQYRSCLSSRSSGGHGFGGSWGGSGGGGGHK